MRNTYRTEQKQHINLSNHADETIRSDAFTFGMGDNLSGMINRILLNYMDDARATLSLSAQRERNRLASAITLQKYIAKNQWDKNLELFNPDVPAEEGELQTIDLLVKQYIAETLEQNRRYTKGQSHKIRLQNEVYDRLYPEDDPAIWPEQDYYRSQGEYIKAVLEEYSDLPFYDREGIYYKPILDILERHLLLPNSERSVLKLIYKGASGDRTVFHIKLHKLLPDPKGTYHYLTAYSRPAASKNVEYEPHVFRMSRIEDIRVYSEKTSGKLTEKQKHTIESLIQKNGVQFLFSNEEPEECRIKLTPAGYTAYCSRFWLRPLYDSIEENEDGSRTMTFHCPFRQIQYYFTGFGKNALVLEPDALVEQFRNTYSEANEAYLEI